MDDVMAVGLSVSEEERELLRTSVRRLLTQQWPVEEALERGSDPKSILEAWRSVAEQGLAALIDDPSQGGLREAVCAFEELGRASCPAPLLGAVILNVLLRSIHQPVPALLNLRSELHEGIAALAVGLGGFDGDVAAGEGTLTRGRLDGEISFVENAESCSRILVLVRAPARAVIVNSNSAGVGIEATPGLAVPPLSNIVFRGVEPECVLETSDAVLANIAQVARICSTARAIGAVTRGFELANEHAKVRRQFGQFIGQFQAIQHKLADCLIRVDGARLTLDAAATAFDLEMKDWKIFAAAAIAYSSSSLRQTILETHHVLGAIGYAEEHEMPRHFRRVHADVARFGGVTRARAELADYLLDPVMNRR